jgi:hypothetical protein
MTKEDIIREFSELELEYETGKNADQINKVFDSLKELSKPWLSKALDKHAEHIIREVMNLLDEEEEKCFGESSKSLIAVLKQKANKLGIKI